VFWLNTSVDGIEVASRSVCVRAVIIPAVAQICFDSGLNALSAAAAQGDPAGVTTGLVVYGMYNSRRQSPIQ
jgi:hypothetical protein